MKIDNHKDNSAQNKTVIDANTEDDETTSAPNEEAHIKENKKIPTDEKLDEISDASVSKKSNDKRIVVGAIIVILVMIVALIVAADAFGETDKKKDSGETVEQVSSESNNRGELKVKITASSGLPPETNSGSQAPRVDVIVYDKDAYTKLEKGDQSTKETLKPIFDKSIKADTKENLLGEIDPGSYYVSIYPGVLDDGTIFRPVENYSFVAKKCDHSDLEVAKERKDHEAICNELIEVTLIVLPVEEMTEESILAAVAHMKEGADKTAAIERATQKITAYQEQQAAFEAAEAERVAAEEAAIAAGNGYRDESGAFVQNPSTGGSAGSESADGYSNGGAGGGPVPPPASTPVWIENWVYSCNVCGYSGSLGDVMAHQDPSAWLNGQTNDPPHGGYSGQDRGYWAQ